MIVRDPREQAIQKILDVLNGINGVRYLSPDKAKSFVTSSGRLVRNHSLVRSEFDAILSKLEKDGIAQFNESDIGLSWGENRMVITVNNWKKFDEYQRKLQDELEDQKDLSSTKDGELNSLGNLHPAIKKECLSLYNSKHFAKAVEEGFKVVRERLRELTTFETGSDAFGLGKGNLYVNGAAAPHVESDFQNAVKFLTMSIDNFRNEKAHTTDTSAQTPERAYEYLVMSSLAMHHLDNAVVKNRIVNPKDRPQKTGKTEFVKAQQQKDVQINKIQILCLKIYEALDYKKLLVSTSTAGVSILPLGNIQDKLLLEDLDKYDAQEVEANLEELADFGILRRDYNSSGSPLYVLAKQGYDAIKQIKTQETKKKSS